MIATSPATIASINPATGKTIGTYHLHEQAQLDAILAGARHAQRAWSRRLVRRARDADARRRDGAPRAQSRTRSDGHPRDGEADRRGEAEVEKCAWVCEYYAEHAEAFLRDEHVASTATESFVAYRPLGVVLAVMPWNFPFWQVFRFAAPALMAGNAGVLKHASNVTGCALEIERIFRDAGFPEGVFSTVVVPGSEVEAPHRRPADRRGDAHRERAGRRFGRLGSGPRAQEDRPRARRLGRVHRAGRRGPRRGGKDRGEGALSKRRTELHLREAIHRRGAGVRRVRRRLRRGDEELRRRRSRRPRDDGRAAGARRSACGSAQAARSVGEAKARASRTAGRRSTVPASSSSRRSSSTSNPQ